MTQIRSMLFLMGVPVATALVCWMIWQLL